jgi:hypothetical protein
MPWTDDPMSPVLGKSVTPDNNRDIADDIDLLDNHFSWTDDRELIDCFLCLSDKDCY